MQRMCDFLIVMNYFQFNGLFPLLKFLITEIYKPSSISRTNAKTNYEFINWKDESFKNLK